MIKKLRNKRNIDMLEGNIFTNTLMFALPLMATGVIQLLFNAIDMIVVGKYSGSASMAAVSSTSSLINLVTNLFIGLSVGSSVAIAKRIGNRNYDEISDAVHTSIAIAFIAGSFLTAVGMIFSKTFLLWMNSPADVIDLSALYLRVYFSGMLGTFIYNFASAILRAKGDSRRPLIALTIAGALNALLNLFFVIVLKMNVAGVGLASSISAYVSAIIVVIALMMDPGPTQLDLKKIHIEKKALIDIVKVGLPAGIQSTIFSLSNTVIQSSINEFGKVVMAGSGASNSITSFVYTAMNAFYQSCLTFTSQNVGAKKIDRVGKIVLICVMFVTITGLTLGFGTYIFGRPLLGFYSNDLDVIEAGMVRMYYICPLYFLYGITEVIVGSLRGMGFSFMPMFVSLLGICVFRLLWVATYFKQHHTIESLYLSYPISWIITLLIQFITFIFVYKNMVRKYRNNN